MPSTAPATVDHLVRIGWAGYLRKPVCLCGWAGNRWKDPRHAEREGARHLAAPAVGPR
jgi:hypothetical protein